MGPKGSDQCYVGVQLTDSPYVAVNMRTMTRMGQAALDELGDEGDFVPGIHTVGKPLEDGVEDVKPCNAENKFIVHFPDTRRSSPTARVRRQCSAWQKCVALRIAR